jgi:hypothetical protein
MSSKKYCSPKNRKNTATCFTDNSLIKIVDEYNNNHTDKIYIPNKKTKLSTSDRERIWKTIKQKLKNETSCNEDYCYLETDTIKKINDYEINKNTFVPEKPIEWYDSPNEWLSNYDIMDVMKQYEDGTDFIFFGPTPIDFDERINFNSCVNQDLCTINLNDIIKNGKTKVGVIFNLDPHTKSGSHWTALFIDINKGGIYYFDSYGIQPPNEVKKLMNRVREQGNKLLVDKKINIDDTYNIELDGDIIDDNTIILNNSKKSNHIEKDDIINFVGSGYNERYRVKDIRNDKSVVLHNNISKDVVKMYKGGKLKIINKDFKEFFNPKRFQFKNSECGMFSMWFIIEFINNRKFSDIITSKIDDDYVFNKRDEYYRPNMKKMGKKTDSIFGIF